MLSLRVIVDRLQLRSLVKADAPDRWVRWVHVSELPDPSPFLRGGELLLLAGTNFRPADSYDYVQRLCESGVVAIGFGLTPVFDAVPTQLVEACTAQDMALLEVPPDVPFESVMELHHAELVRAETLALERLSEGQSTLIRAASGPKPIQSVVDRLAGLIDGWVLVVDRNRDRTWSVGPVRHDPDILTALERASASRSPSSATLSSENEQIEVHRLVGPMPTGYAMAVARDVPFTVADRGIVGVAASALSLLFTDPHTTASPEELGAAVVSVVLRLPAFARRLASTVELPEHVSWRVARGVTDGSAGQREVLLHRLSGLLETPFVELSDVTFTALMADRLDIAELRHRVDDAGYPTGFSRLYPAARLELAVAEADTAFDGARLCGSSVVAGGRPPGILSLLGRAQAADYVDNLLGPIDAAGSSADLLVTLRSWLAHHGNWDRTAADLGVHRNTVRHRLRQVARSLDRDLNDPDVRMELWFALQWRGYAR